MIHLIKNLVGDFVSEEHIKKYLEFNTGIPLIKNGECVAWVQFNVKGHLAHVTMMVIKKGINGVKVINYFLREAKRRFPIEKIEFERETRGDPRKRVYKI